MSSELIVAFLVTMVIAATIASPRARSSGGSGGAVSSVRLTAGLRRDRPRRAA